MADKKISETTVVTTLPSNALIPAIDMARTVGDRNVAITVPNLSKVTAPTEEDIISTVLEPTIVAGAYTFTTDNARMFVFSITENTTLTPPTLSNSTALAFTAIVDGAFSLTLASSDITPTSDTYDGAVRNRLIFDSYKLASGVQVNNVSIENLAT